MYIFIYLYIILKNNTNFDHKANIYNTFFNILQGFLASGNIPHAFYFNFFLGKNIQSFYLINALGTDKTYLKDSSQLGAMCDRLVFQLLNMNDIFLLWLSLWYNHYLILKSRYKYRIWWTRIKKLLLFSIITLKRLMNTWISIIVAFYNDYDSLCLDKAFCREQFNKKSGKLIIVDLFWEMVFIIWIIYLTKCFEKRFL